MLTVMLPSGLVVSGLDPACSRSGRAVACTLGTLAPWQSRDVKLKLRSKSARTVSLLAASIAGSLPELDASNNSATKSTKVT